MLRRYKVLRKGDGTSHPTADSSCSCHYGGKLINGETFDSSYDRGSPTDFAPNQVIKGWTEAMQLMVEGDKWEMYIPSELGYGDSVRKSHWNCSTQLEGLAAFVFVDFVASRLGPEPRSGSTRVTVLERPELRSGGRNRAVS